MAKRDEKPMHMTPQKTSPATIDPASDDRRKGVRRTVTILVAIVAAFFLVSFLQIALMR